MRKLMLAGLAVFTLAAAPAVWAQTGTGTTGTTTAPTTSAPMTATAASVLSGMTVDEAMSLSVFTADGEDVGSIGDFVIGADNQLQQAIIDVGGFLGMGQKQIAVDIGELSLAQGDGEGFTLPMTREEVDAMPEWGATAEVN